MGDPRAVEAHLRLAFLVRPHGCDRPLGGLRVLARGNQRGHAAHRKGAAPVTRLDEQLRVGRHERDPHGDVAAVRQYELGALAEGLDRGEDVVPATRVQPVGVIAQLIQDLVHLKRGGKGLDQHRRPHQPRGETEPLLAPGEHLIPEPRLAMVLELWQIQVHTLPTTMQARRTVKREQAEVEQRTRKRVISHTQMALLQMPSAGAHDQRGGLLAKLVRAPPVVGVGDRAVDRIDQIRLTDDLVAPRR